MMAHRRWLPVTALLVLMATTANGQGSAALTPAQATAFLGTWVIDMTEPAAFTGTHTIRVWDRGGVVAASLQPGKTPFPIEATGMHKDGDMLVLTFSHRANPKPLLENGAPIWAVISLTLDGDTMKVAQMLERSQTIKRGTGKKQMD
jgi:hypothetical protein